MKFRTLIAAAAAVTALSAGAASAEEAPKLTLSYNFAAATEYVFRGVSQSNEQAAAQAGVDATYGQFYAGVWTSNVNFKYYGDTSTSQEIDGYAGWRPAIEGLSLDLGVIYYGYVDQPNYLPKVDYWEGAVKVGKAFGPVSLGVAGYYSPAFTGTREDAYYVEGTGAYTINDKFAISGALGHQALSKSTSDYTTWNAGLTYTIKPGISLDLRYYDTDKNSFGDPYHARGVAVLKAAF
jgi:uncharacterized protein (TIGR02001 family)